MPHFVFDHLKKCSDFQAAESTQTPLTPREWHAHRVRVVMKAPKSGQLKANGLWVFHQTGSVTSSKPSNPERRDCPQCLQWMAAVTTRRRLPSHYPGKQLSLDVEMNPTFGDYRESRRSN